MQDRRGWGEETGQSGKTSRKEEGVVFRRAVESSIFIVFRMYFCELRVFRIQIWKPDSLIL